MQLSDSDSWSVVIPYFNEEDYIRITLDSLLRQTLLPRNLILVNNGSTDASERVCRSATRGARDLSVRFLHEDAPGQVHALEKGIAAVDTDFVAICDADTFYPPHYLALANSIFKKEGRSAAAVMAIDIHAEPNSFPARAKRAKGVAVSRILKNQCHTGGYGMCFATTALCRAGGYSGRLWPYVVKDHELVNRVLKVGRTVYHYDLWCRPSDRRSDRADVRWTLWERLLYHATPYAAKDWYFHEFLTPRLRRRSQFDSALRKRSWQRRA